MLRGQAVFAALVLVVALAAGALLAPASTPAASQPLTASVPAIYWGAEIGSQFSGTSAPWDMRAVTDFQRRIGKSPSIVAFNTPFSICQGASCSAYPFPTAEMDKLRGYGALPMLNWGSSVSPIAGPQSAASLQNITRGRDDAYLRSFAAQVAQWGHPFFLRFDWEMNGNWFPWKAGTTPRSTRTFVMAWRHVHDIFARAGATNATWVWCPYVMRAPSAQRFASMYPGDRYVDWTCLDGFNWGSRKNPHAWQTFDSLYHASYQTITAQIAPSKPMLLGEVGSSEYGGSKPAWIRTMLSQLRTREPRVRAFLWFDVIDPRPRFGRLAIPIESSVASLHAFMNGINRRAFTTNTFRAAIVTPIKTPSVAWPIPPPPRGAPGLP